MTKKEFLEHVEAIYRCGNRSDHESRYEHGEEWTHEQMAGRACCSLLDRMLYRLTELDVMTEAEYQKLMDTL